MSIRTAVTAAALAACVAVPLTATAADAAPANVLRGFCSHRVTTACVAVADNDDGVLTIRDARGHRHVFHRAATALRYVRHHAPACREEDSPACWWDASTAGNRIGWSFLSIGGHREGDGTLFYLRNLD